MQRGEVHGAVHAAEEGGGAGHGLHHLFVAAHGLDAQGDGLQLGFHLVEFLDVSVGGGGGVSGGELGGEVWGGGLEPPCANKILSLDLTRPHLSVLCALFDFDNQFLLLPLELLPLAVELALGFFQGALVLRGGVSYVCLSRGETQGGMWGGEGEWGWVPSAAAPAGSGACRRPIL